MQPWNCSVIYIIICCFFSDLLFSVVRVIKLNDQKHMYDFCCCLVLKVIIYHQVDLNAMMPYHYCVRVMETCLFLYAWAQFCKGKWSRQFTDLKQHKTKTGVSRHFLVIITFLELFPARMREQLLQSDFGKTEKISEKITIFAIS